MPSTTGKYANSPAETPKRVDAVNAVNHSAKPTKRAYPRTVVVLFLACLAVIAAKAVPANADAGDSYNDGLKIAVCQLFDSGYTGPQVAAELKKCFASFEKQTAKAGGDPRDYSGFVKLLSPTSARSTSRR